MPKLLGYGVLSLILAMIDVVNTAFAVGRLQVMLEAHRKLWQDIKNQVKFAPRSPSARTDTMLIQAREYLTLAEEEAVCMVTSKIPWRGRSLAMVLTIT